MQFVGLIVFGLSAGNAVASNKPEPIAIAVASNFRHAMQALVEEYQKQHTQPIKLVFGSSGQLAAQLQHGAPYAAFYAANYDYAATQAPPALLLAPYAKGRLALVSHRQKHPRQFLLHNSPRTLAIANPKLAPYGQAALETLNALAPKKPPKLITSSNASRAALHALKGSTDLGFIALADLPRDWPKQQQWLVPEALHSPITQYAVLLDKRASEFFHFTLSPSAQRVIRQQGYQ